MKKFLLALCLVSAVSFNVAAHELGEPVGGVVTDRRTGNTMALYDCGYPNPSGNPELRSVKLVVLSESGAVLSNAGCGAIRLVDEDNYGYVRAHYRIDDPLFLMAPATYATGGDYRLAPLTILSDIVTAPVMLPVSGFAVMGRAIRRHRVAKVYEQVLLVPGSTDEISHHLFNVVANLAGAYWER